ncbi:unnamed protein product [Arctogadus glacialis]
MNHLVCSDPPDLLLKPPVRDARINGVKLRVSRPQDPDELDWGFGCLAEDPSRDIENYHTVVWMGLKEVVHIELQLHQCVPGDGATVCWKARDWSAVCPTVGSLEPHEAGPARDGAPLCPPVCREYRSVVLIRLLVLTGHVEELRRAMASPARTVLIHPLQCYPRLPSKQPRPSI